MTNNEHPITPPPELVEEWCTDFFGCKSELNQSECYIATQAARWGADQELEACIFWLIREGWFSSDGTALQKLRAYRRPQPTSLKQQALAALQREEEQWPAKNGCRAKDRDTIRRALESLPD